MGGNTSELVPREPGGGGPPEGERPSQEPLVLLGLGVVTASVLASQLVLSRLLGATVGYYFAFVLISFAMLGLASGALAVYFALPRMGLAKATLFAGAATLAGAVSLHVGILSALQHYVGVLGPHLSREPGASVTALLWVLASLLPFYLFTGFAVSILLAASADRFHVAYSVDLAGAAAGCGLALLALSTDSPVQVALTALAPAVGVGATLLALGARRPRVALLSCAVSLGLLLAGRQLCRSENVKSPPHVDWLKHPRYLTAWNSFSSVTLHPGRFFTWALSPTYRGPSVPMVNLMIDGLGGTQIAQFDGKVESLARYDYLDADLTALSDRLLKPGSRQLIIGPGGGVDILQAVRAGRRDVTAVEINPLVVEVVNGVFGRFSGRPYFLPGVRLFVENGRTFLRRSRETWDLISLTWVDTGGNTTALAASENYLYTVEAFEDYLAHLSDDGSLAFLRALGVRPPDLPMDALRGVSVAAEALARRGAAVPGEHVLVAAVESPFFSGRGMVYVLVKRSPFRREEVEAARAFCRDGGFTLLWTPDGPAEEASLPAPWRPVVSLLGRILDPREDRTRLYREAHLDVAPSTDDNPFYFVERSGPNRKAGPGLKILAWCSALLAVLVLAFVLVPLAPTVRTAPALTAPEVSFLGYCALLGTGFMLVEIEFFHTFGLVLGSPTWALGTVLSVLLLFSGLGSMSASRIAASPGRLAAAFGALLAVLTAFVLARSEILTRLVGLELWLRVLLTGAVLAPIAFLMGIPMAAGMSRVGNRPMLRMWGWAANGALSVLASVAAIFLAIHAGITLTFVAGIVAYALAAGTLAVVLRTSERLHPEG
ncbi:MAG: spermidine synthase [Thermoanaerobaculia bacterium]